MYGELWCGVWYGAQYSLEWYPVVWFDEVWFDEVWYSIAWYTQCGICSIMT